MVDAGKAAFLPQDIQLIEDLVLWRQKQRKLLPHERKSVKVVRVVRDAWTFAPNGELF